MQPTTTKKQGIPAKKLLKLLILTPPKTPFVIPALLGVGLKGKVTKEPKDSVAS